MNFLFRNFPTLISLLFHNTFVDKQIVLLQLVLFLNHRPCAPCLEVTVLYSCSRLLEDFTQINNQVDLKWIIGRVTNEGVRDVVPWGIYCGGGPVFVYAITHEEGSQSCCVCVCVCVCADYLLTQAWCIAYSPQSTSFLIYWALMLRRFSTAFWPISRASSLWVPKKMVLHVLFH
jgi:hypothetical protein